MGQLSSGHSIPLHSHPSTTTCATCQRSCAAPAQAPLHPWEWPTHPWSRLHVDYAEPYLGHRFLVIIDAHSKWLEVCPMTSTTAVATVERLRSLLAQFGIPDMVVTDNGTNCQCRVPAIHAPEWSSSRDLCFGTSCIKRSSRNGCKDLQGRPSQMKEGSLMDRLSSFLFWYRNAPQQTTGVFPAELLMGRRLQSALDLVHPDLASRVAKAQASH